MTEDVARALLSEASADRPFAAYLLAITLGLRRTLASLAFLTVTTARPAGAHPVLEVSDPRAGVVVAQRPRLVKLQFAKPVEQLARVRVYNDRGLRVDRGATRTRDRSVTVSLIRNLTAGTYVVHWRAVGVDGHPASDSLVFDYLHSSRAGVVLETRDTTSRSRGILRWFALAKLALALGARPCSHRTWHCGP